MESNEQSPSGGGGTKKSSTIIGSRARGDKRIIVGGKKLTSFTVSSENPSSIIGLQNRHRSNLEKSSKTQEKKACFIGTSSPGKVDIPSAVMKTNGSIIGNAHAEVSPSAPISQPVIKPLLNACVSNTTGKASSYPFSATSDAKKKIEGEKEHPRKQDQHDLNIAKESIGQGPLSPSSKDSKKVVKSDKLKNASSIASKLISNKHANQKDSGDETRATAQRNAMGVDDAEDVAETATDNSSSLALIKASPPQSSDGYNENTLDENDGTNVEDSNGMASGRDVAENNRATMENSSATTTEQQSISVKPDDSRSNSKTNRLHVSESSSASGNNTANGVSSNIEGNGIHQNKEKGNKSTNDHSVGGGSTIETRHGSSSSSQNRSYASERNLSVTNESVGRSVQNLSALETSYSSRHHVVDAGIFGNLSNSKQPSFLESLSEEERRTRTRHVPAVEGFRRLHKSEIKRDIKLAKSLFSSVVDDGEAADDLAAASMEDSESLMAIDISDENPSVISGAGNPGPFAPPGDDDQRPSTGGKCMDGAGPSSDGEGCGEGSGSNSSGGTQGKQGSASCVDGDGLSLRSPHIVESLTAFNPPRPPESDAAKKKHRLLRWERNPKEVEIDLNNYKKTVVRTREELHAVESERERVETVGSTLRLHFLHNLKALREESIDVNKEMNRMQVKCAEEADLKRTRSKGSNSMRDVLSVLRSRGGKTQHSTAAEEEKKNLSSSPRSNFPPCHPPGIGGVCFGDNTAASALTRMVKSGVNDAVVAVSGVHQIASAWVLPGDKVMTAYGTGVVESVFGSTVLDPNTPSTTGEISPKSCSGDESTVERCKEMDSTTHPQTMSNGRQNKILVRPEAMPSGKITTHGKTSVPETILSSSPCPKRNKTPNQPPINMSSCTGLFMLPPRISVKLSYGLAYLQPHEVVPLNNPNSYSDMKLSSRWKAMVSTAFLVGVCPDTAAMNRLASKEGYNHPPGDAATLDDSGLRVRSQEASLMSPSSSQVDDEESVSIERVSSSQKPLHEQHEVETRMDGNIIQGVGTSSKNSKYALAVKNGGINHENGKDLYAEELHRVIPFGGGMLPTPGNRGDLLPNLPLQSLQTSLDSVLSNGIGILSKETHTTNVPSGMSEWEKQREVLYATKGKVLTLRNHLYRQRKARIMNERGYASAYERADRVEVLLTEMKADLKSLKERLKEELTELGIDQEKAQEMLAIHFKEQNEINAADDHRLKKRHKKRSDVGSDTAVLRTSRRKAEEAAKATQSCEADNVISRGRGNISVAHQVETSIPIPRRAPKRGRGDEPNHDAVASSKPKRSYNRRQ